MNRLLPRYFFLVLLSITVASVVVYFVARFWFGDPIEEIARRQSAAQIFLLEQFVDKAGSDEWLVRLNKVRDISNIRYELIPLDTALDMLDATKAHQLQQGAVVLDVANKSFFRRVDLNGERYIGSEDDVIHVQGLPIDTGLEVQLEALRFVIIALFVLVPVIFWSRAHRRDLDMLSKAADEFGEGRFGNQIVMKETADMFPLAEGMNAMALRIQTLLGAHRTLLHSVSHELRTPIARLEFGLELLREESSAQLPVARLAAMEEDIHELNSLVNELLNLTKLEHQQTCKPEQFILADLIADLSKSIQYSLHGKTFSVDISDELITMEADPRLLNRALGNLLLNAVKYGRSKVRLTVRSAPGGAVEMSVEDDGPGIPPAERERIFEPFYRLDQSRDRNTGGFGLGLAIAQKAMLLQGAGIRIGDSDLGGARFYFILPRPA